MPTAVLKLCLVRHGETRATRARAFGADEPLLADARAAAANRLPAALPDGAAARCSPARRCRETAIAAGLHATVDPGLDQVDVGAWRGRTFAEVHDADPAAMAGWLSDPRATPHGGESLQALGDRVGRWLDELAPDAAGTLVAVTHSEVVRVIVVRALALPLRVFWQLAVDPLSLTELRRDDAAWTLGCLNRAVAG